MKNSFDLHAAPLQDRLAHAKDCYRLANNFIRFRNAANLNEMLKDVKRLDPYQRSEWAVLWQNVADIQDGLTLPGVYVELLGQAHQSTWQGLSQDGLPASPRTMNFNDRISTMQKIADFQARFWCTRFLDVFSGFKGTRVLPLHDATDENRMTQYSLVPAGERGLYAYNVADGAERFGLWTHVAAHEPQHAVQHYLSEMLREGINLPDPLKEAAQIFSFYQEKGVGNLPPSLFCGEDGRPYDELGYQVARAYSISLTEVAAHYQGAYMEKAMEESFPSPSVLQSRP